MNEVHRNWYFFSIKALLGQLAKELLHDLNSSSRERLKLCLKRIVYTKDLRKTAVKSTKFAPPLLKSPSKSPVHRVANLFVSLFGKATADELPHKWSTTYRSIVRLSKVIDNNENLPGARVYNMRIYDLVMDGKETKHKEEIMNVPPFLQSAFNIVKSFSGAKNARILSPRIAPLLPDKSSKGFLSPSIFPFYKDDTEQQVMPVPKMLEAAGLNEKDRERVLEMVMEVSGARDAIGKIFEQLLSSLTPHQNKEMNRRGFTFMSPKQIEELHKKQNLNEPEVREQMDEYKKLPKWKREEMLWRSIGELAGFNTRRRKRKINPLVVLKPAILSPYQFAPVYGATVLGPVILSPNLFSPLILNPSMLGPWILSPSFPLPFIVSPYVLSPYILSPLAMAPFVLSPYVLSPNIMNPYVLSPVILSPIVVCPDILSPMALGGIILSPNVLSPSILSKSFLMTSILSPSLLS
ncbi:unnamed protein product [Strongylus vulgaris]|uniref:Uncharacterized protein n=1 Tax=Strongylus vulgaris TaxID=40348 RepID=A0A3P7HZ40_STRVU|nr:unnamed protein product [Strongylus vulgaris]